MKLQKIINIAWKRFKISEENGKEPVWKCMFPELTDCPSSLGVKTFELQTDDLSNSTTGYDFLMGLSAKLYDIMQWMAYKRHVTNFVIHYGRNAINSKIGNNLAEQMFATGDFAMENIHMYGSNEYESIKDRIGREFIPFYDVVGSRYFSLFHLFISAFRS